MPEPKVQIAAYAFDPWDSAETVIRIEAADIELLPNPPTIAAPFLVRAPRRASGAFPRRPARTRPVWAAAALLLVLPLLATGIAAAFVDIGDAPSDAPTATAPRAPVAEREPQRIVLTHLGEAPPAVPPPSGSPRRAVHERRASHHHHAAPRRGTWDGLLRPGAF